MPPAPRPPARSRASLWILLAGVLLAAAVAGVLLTQVRIERQHDIAERLERHALFARVLEDHAARSVGAVALVAGNVAEALARGGAAAVAGSGFATELGSLPQLRALAVVDARGRVMASSVSGEVGLTIDLNAFGRLPDSNAERVGAYLPARSLADFARGTTPRPVPRGVGVLPVLRHAVMPDGAPALVVALLNPETLATHMRLAVNDPQTLAVLAHYDGRLLASTDPAAAEPGRDLAAIELFRSRLPKRDHGEFVGTALRGDDEVVAFRASRQLPLVVFVERSRESVLALRAGREATLLAGGTVVGLFLILAAALAARSLRARAQAQEQVARSERELSTIVGSVQELLFRTDPAGVLTFVNARWMGVAEDSDPLGATLSSLAMPGHRGATAALFDPHGGAQPRTAHVELKTRGGPRRYEIAVTPLMERGRIVGFAGSAVDVTERHVAQQRLQQQLDFTELLFEIVPIPISMLDADGRYRTVNRAWEQFTGRSRAEVTGRPAGAMLTPAEREQHERVDRRLLGEGGSHRYEARYRRVDGELADLLISKVAVPGTTGGWDGILCAFMDITELRAAERAIREARDVAEEASRSKSEFIANISHELRTPLQSIIGFSELGSVRGRQHEKLAAMFTDIHASGQRMLALVNDLLDVAKLESTVGTFHLERTDLRTLLREVIRELGPLLTPRGLVIDARISEQPLVAKVDPLRFQQVVRNVLANAIKFSPDGGSIDVTAEPTPDGQIHIGVRDRGPGIPPAELEKIFEAFVQSSKTKDGSGGTGLGLAICRKIVVALGGRVHAENADGGGSIFHIHLPTRGFADTAPAELAP